jgi:hypothetical protein
MFGRIRDFLRVHVFSDATHVGLVARFEALLVRVLGLAVEEQAGRLEASAATKHRKALRHEVYTEIVRYVARVGEIAAQARPDLTGRFRAPRGNASNPVFLARSWDMLNLARAHQEVLGANGLAASQIDALGTALTQLEAVTERANAGRGAHVGARAELKRATGELVQLVGLLDVLNRARFKHDAKLLAAWESARNVVGPIRVTPDEPAPSGEPATGGETPPTVGGDQGRVA